MERIWAPWRMRYIETVDSGGCIFCEKLEDGQDDRENLVLLRGKKCFIVLNLYPYTNGHLMVVPYRHAGSPVDLEQDELLEFAELARQGMRILEKSIAPHGFNLGINVGRAAGAGVEGHVHFHVVPRWEGDTNYMAVVSGSRVIPESLEETYEKLQRAVQELGLG